MLESARSYEDLIRHFRWRIPDYYNIGVDVCDRHARGERHLALIFIEDDNRVERFSFDDIKNLSNRFATH